MGAKRIAGFLLLLAFARGLQDALQSANARDNSSIGIHVASEDDEHGLGLAVVASNDGRKPTGASSSRLDDVGVFSSDMDYERENEGNNQKEQHDSSSSGPGGDREGVKNANHDAAASANSKAEPKAAVSEIGRAHVRTPVTS